MSSMASMTMLLSPRAAALTSSWSRHTLTSREADAGAVKHPGVGAPTGGLSTCEAMSSFDTGSTWSCFPDTDPLALELLQYTKTVLSRSGEQ
jgi:hypothetical protein